MVEVKTASLEDRLNKLGDNVKQRLVEELLKPLIKPKDVIDGKVELKDSRAKKLLQNRYLKDDVVPYIAGRLEEDGVNFESVDGKHNFRKSLYNSINKEPMKRAFWGQFNAYVPEEIMQELHPWAAFYLYAGIWNRKATPLPHKRIFRKVINNQTIYRIVYDCVRAGLDAIKGIHNQKEDKGEYKHPMNDAPHKKEVLGIMLKPTNKNPYQLLFNFNI